MTVPADIVNRALDAIGRSDIVIGDPEEGTEAAKVALRAYGPCLRQLLRAAHWNFARKQASMTLLADATGATSGVGTTVTTPWIYEYMWPIDAMKARFVPMNPLQATTVPAGNIQLPATPLTTGGSQPLTGQRLIPARFLVGLDFNYPPVQGSQPDWNQSPQWWEVAGEGPVQRTVIYTNVPNAELVYTALVLYPDEWDPLFGEAMVQALAARLALALTKDKRLGLELRRQAVAAARDAVIQARLSDGNEGWFSSDVGVDWMRVRQAGRNYAGPYGGDGPGYMWCGWDSFSLGGDSAF